jgi:ribonucleotide reductase alpha subunit
MLKTLAYGLSEPPPSLVELCAQPFNLEAALDLASTLGRSTLNYDHHILGGRLLIYALTRSCPDVPAYISAYSHRLNPDIVNFMAKFHLELSAAMHRNETREYSQYDFFSASCLIRQYLLKTSWNEHPLESIQMLNMRQAVQFYHTRGLSRVLQCYEELSAQQFTHASPTIFNAGTSMNQGSSCFLIKVGDNIDDISGTVHTISCISKLNGGVGIQVGDLRHSAIGYVGTSEGPCGFLSIYDKTIGKISQGGKRNGAGTAFLPSWHYDFDVFVKMTDNYMDPSQRLTDLNTAAWMNDLLFIRIKNAARAEKIKAAGGIVPADLKTQWTMFCPKKANILKGKHGMEFIQLYEQLEATASARELEYAACLAEVDRLYRDLMTTPTHKIRTAYIEAIAAKLQASDRRIDHKIIDAYQLYKSIIGIQINSGMPYMMNAEACQKSNQKNLGSIEQSNLCLEILEVTSPASRDSPPVIASCNLGSMNIPHYVRGKIDWLKQEFYVSPQDCIPDLLEAFDFAAYGAAVRSLTENLNQVIDENYYPLDGPVRGSGIIASTNFQNRPLGIGVSGQSDALYLMDCPFDGQVHIMFNKMLYACQYWHSLVSSLILAIQHGAYATFRTGSYRRFVSPDNAQADAYGMVEIEGSPLSNGQFQFDLWQEEAAMLKHHGLLDEKIYDVNDDIPLEPVIWGERFAYIYIRPYDLESRCEFSYEKRELLPNEEMLVLFPTWDCLRRLIQLHGVRNSLLMANMPTASSANLLRNCESTEAHQSMIYSRDLKSGNYTILVRHLYYDLKELDLWSSDLAQFIAASNGSIKYIKEYIQDHAKGFNAALFKNGRLLPDVDARLTFLISKYKTMYEISQKFVLTLTRQRGIYFCQSQSTNIYLRDPTVEQLSALHLYANALRLKTGMYYLRQSPANSAGDFTIPAELIDYCKKLSGRQQAAAKSQVPAVACSAKNKADCVDCSA